MKRNRWNSFWYSWTPYIQTIIISTYNLHKNDSWDIIHPFFHSISSDSCILHLKLISFWTSHSADALWSQVPVAGGLCAGRCGWGPAFAPLPVHLLCCDGCRWSWLRGKHQDTETRRTVPMWIIILTGISSCPFSTSWRRLSGAHSLPPNSHTPRPSYLEMATVTAAKLPWRLEGR